MINASVPQYAPPKARPVLPARWLSNAESIVIDDVELTTGLIYFGTTESSLPHTNPGMVDPFLPVSYLAAQPDDAPALDVLPDYRYLTEDQRASYRDWLSSGRRDPDCPEAYVLLFVLGLERRILVDCLPHPEFHGDLPELADELFQLRQQYAALSVSTNIQALLDYIQLVLEGREAQPESERPALSLEKAHTLPSFEISKALRYCAQTGEPVETALAYALLRATHFKELNSIAFKDETIFRRQFEHHFDKRFPSGIQLAIDESRKEASYEAFCPELQPYVVPLLPALAEHVLHERTQELLWLAFCATRDMQPFERAAADLARYPHLLSLALLDAYLPGASGERPIVRKLDALAEHVATQPVEFTAQELAAWFGEEGDLPEPARVFLANTLNYHGISTSPDLRTLEHPDDTVQVFVGLAPKESSLSTVQSTDLEQVVFLASILGKHTALSVDELRFVQTFVAETLPGRRHLRGELLEPLEDGTLCADSLTRAASVRAFTPLTEAQRSEAARFLFALALLDGPLSEDQTRILGRVYPLLGIAAHHLQADLIAQSTNAPADTYSFNRSLDSLDGSVFLASSQAIKSTPTISLESVLTRRALVEPEKPLATLVFERALKEFAEEVKRETQELSLGELLLRLGIAGTISRTLLKLVSEAFIEHGLALDPDPRWQIPGNADVPMKVYVGEPKALPLLLDVARERLHAAAGIFATLAANPNASPEETSLVSAFFAVETNCSPGEHKLIMQTFDGSRYFGGRTTSIRKLQALTRQQRQGLVAAFFKFCHAAKEPSPSQIQGLEKLYLALGYPSRSLYSDLHTQATGADAEEFSFSEPPGVPFKQTTYAERMVVTPAVGSGANSVFNIKSLDPEPISREYSPPLAPTPTSLSHSPRSRTLDTKKLAARREETREVQAMLATEFGAYDVAKEAQSLVPPPSAQGLMGLDARHSQFVQELLSRSSWSREEAVALATSMGLRLDGAYEIINEAAFSVLDDVLLEGDDPIELNPDTLEKLKNGNSN